MFSLKKLAKVAVPTVLALTMSSQAFALDDNQCKALSGASMVVMMKYQQGLSLKQAKAEISKEFPGDDDAFAMILSIVYTTDEYPVEKTKEKKDEAVRKFGKQMYEMCTNS
ncbi:Uncharacterised protein [Moraxella lacunata]|uniref:Uncharacterized protein n=1 Tax=Moraxella lacunata TaxID=477 RepID=A0A378TTC3_MORLA|nr:hypothetical protein [Moraxella lacunata]STZ64079.1 Uncharacterised protein [Moraxella lacunata]